LDLAKYGCAASTWRIAETDVELSSGVGNDIIFNSGFSSKRGLGECIYVVLMTNLADMVHGISFSTVLLCSLD
jgi:hypothetical protein